MRRIAAIVLLIAALAGCTRTAQSGRTNAWTIPGVLRLGEPDEPDSLNLMFAHSSASDLVDALLFTHILRYDANGNAIPDLALQVPTTANGGISRD